MDEITTPMIPARRPLATRSWPLFIWAADSLATIGVTANAISILGVVFCAAAGIALAATSHFDGWRQAALFFAAPVLIQLRLACNLLDGMVAERRKGFSAIGELYNEVPDRISDAAVFVGAGYAAGGEPWLGYAAALMAVFVAYIRAIGAGLGAGQQFTGPMAKPHRMAAITFTLLCIAVIRACSNDPATASDVVMKTGLWVVVIGSVITAVHRLSRISTRLRATKVQP